MEVPPPKTISQSITPGVDSPAPAAPGFVFDDEPGLIGMLDSARFFGRSRGSMRGTTVGREVLANTLMSVPVLRPVRIRASRAIGHADEGSRRQWVDLERELGDLAGKVVFAGVGPGDAVDRGLPDTLLMAANKSGA